MEYVIGIDLGTTNSCVAVVQNGVPTVLPNRQGYKTTPSMIAMTESKKRLVGHLAKRQSITNAEFTVYAAKRFIGRKWNSEQVRQIVKTTPYRVVEGPHGDVRIELRDRSYAVPEISAMVLAEMKAIAEEYVGQEVQKAVITVPAYFNDNQRQATKDAGTIAGLDVIRIINEPTAAALAYGFGRRFDKQIAVYDLGGGTFDISVLEMSSDGVFKVISTAGDTFLGGEDWDNRVIDWLVEGFSAEHGIDLRSDRMALQRLKDAAEKAKIELSGQRETEVNLPFIITSGRNEALHLQRVMTRADFERLTADLVQRTIDIVSETLDDAGIGKEEIEDVVLVGGMTRVPSVERAVAQLFGREPSKGVHPDEVVALGAAIQGAALVERGNKMILLDVTPHTLGVMVAGGMFEPLIPQNTTVPTSRTRTFTTSRDNQTAVKILVMQGENERAQDNELLGEFILDGLRKANAGSVEIDVTFEINADGIVSVTAKDLETQRDQTIIVAATSGLTKDEIRSMIDEGRRHAVDRKVGEEFEARKQETEQIIIEIEQLFAPVERVVGQSDFGRDALTRARGVVDRARQAILAKDQQQLKEHADSLSRTLRMFKGVVARM
ncbi:MAG: molecular chaperone DnaK [Deltaproteobacteria bacterium]|nr:molecular chaperone DnaK [Deltaproteobacteria bacterium]